VHETFVRGSGLYKEARRDADITTDSSERLAMESLCSFHTCYRRTTRIEAERIADRPQCGVAEPAVANEHPLYNPFRILLVSVEATRDRHQSKPKSD
jgi:hypothetical protein